MRLVAENVHTWIYGDCPRGLLDPVLSYTKAGVHFAKSVKAGHWDGRYRLLRKHPERKQLYFPTGLLGIVLEKLNTAGIPYQIDDHRTASMFEEDPSLELFDVKHGTIRLDEGKFDYQAVAVYSALTKCRGILDMATNSGKTEVGAAIIKALNRRTVWFTHRKNLLYQTRERLAERLQQPIGIIGDSECEYQDVTVAMVQTCGNRKHDDFLQSCQVVFGDEVHHLESNQWYNNFAAVPAGWRFGLTATPPPLDEAGMLLRAMTGPILFKITSLELIRRGVSVPPRVWIASPKLKKFPSKTSWPDVYMGGIVENHDRNLMIAEMVLRFREDDKPSLTLVHRLKHCDILKKMQDRLGLPTAIINGSVTQGKRDKILKDLVDRKLANVVAVAKTMGEGVNLPDLRAIINATGTRCGGNASEDATGRDTVQFLGRGLRTAPGKEYIDYADFADVGHRYLKRASLDRLGTLKQQGFGLFIERWESYEGDSNGGCSYSMPEAVGATGCVGGAGV